METSAFEKIGGTYRQVGNVLLPNLELPDEEEREHDIGVFGQRRLRYIMEHKSGLYSGLILECRLYSYLEDIERQAEELLLRTVDSMAATEGVTEKLKNDDQLEWIRRMNNIRERALEYVNSEIIYA